MSFLCVQATEPLHALTMEPFVDLQTLESLSEHPAAEGGVKRRRKEGEAPAE